MWFRLQAEWHRGSQSDRCIVAQRCRWPDLLSIKSFHLSSRSFLLTPQQTLLRCSPGPRSRSCTVLVSSRIAIRAASISTLPAAEGNSSSASCSKEGAFALVLISQPSTNFELAAILSLSSVMEVMLGRKIYVVLVRGTATMSCNRILYNGNTNSRFC